MADDPLAMSVYLRLLTERAEQALATHEATLDGLERAVREAAAIRQAVTEPPPSTDPPPPPAKSGRLRRIAAILRIAYPD